MKFMDFQRYCLSIDYFKIIDLPKNPISYSKILVFKINFVKLFTNKTIHSILLLTNEKRGCHCEGETY